MRYHSMIGLKRISGKNMFIMIQMLQEIDFHCIGDRIPYF